MLDYRSVENSSVEGRRIAVLAAAFFGLILVDRLAGLGCLIQDLLGFKALGSPPFRGEGNL